MASEEISPLVLPDWHERIDATNRKWVRLNDVCSDIVDCPHSTPTYTQSGEFYIVRTQDFRGGMLDLSNAARVSPATFSERTKRVTPRHGDVIYSREGAYHGIAAEVPRNSKVCLGQRTVLIRPDASKVNSRFLRYWLNSDRVRGYIAGHRAGSAAPRINLPSIRGVPVAVPPLAEQDLIARILGSLDDKIELNRRMNATLEAMARALFRSWFVDFDPIRAKLDGRKPTGLEEAVSALFPAKFEESVRGSIPRGWTIEPIGEVVSCVGGGTPSTTEPAFWDGGSHHWTTPKDFSALEAPVLTDTERKITDAGVASISSGLLPAGTVLMSSRAPVGYLAISAIPVAINQGFIAMKPNDRASNYFLLNWCHENMPQIEARATGTTFAEISKQNFRPIPVVLPPRELMAAFTRTVAPFYEQITANVRQSRTLALIRDTLLPKLLSGELRIA